MTDGPEAPKMMTFIVDVEEIQRNRVTVQAMSQAEAEAEIKKVTILNRTPPTYNFRVAAAWPTDEGEESLFDLGNGYMLRRGWFYQAVCTGGKFGHGERTVSFTPAQIETEGEVTVASFPPPLLDASERVRYFHRVYGWGGSYIDLTTWSRVFKTEKEAYRATRKFVEESKQFDRDRLRRERRIAEDIRMENLMRNAVQRMAVGNQSLTRLDGGKWVTSDPGYYPDGSPVVYEEKWLVTLLLDTGRAYITDRMNKSGDPRVITLTEEGRAFAQTTKEAACLNL